MARWYDIVGGGAAIASIGALLYSYRDNKAVRKIEREDGGNTRTFGLHDYTREEGDPLPDPFPQPRPRG